MAKFKQDTTLKLITTKTGDIEEIKFSQGDTVSITQTWDKFYLVKDENGHYYNVPKERIEA